MKLYFVGYTNENGDSHDHFVRAPSAKEALRIWRDNYEIEDDLEAQLYLLPDHEGPAEAIDWEKIKCA